MGLNNDLNSLMKVDQINFNNLRVFETVYKEKSMTAAARRLHLTQSGVSQHILSLEEDLGLKLFDRINKKIIPTEAGKRLFQTSRPALLEIENTISELYNERGKISGTVSLGMPIDFGTHMIIPKLAALGQLHPGLDFEVELGNAPVLAEKIYDGTLDFAFVDSFTFDKSVHVEPVASETLLLCGSHKYLEAKGELKMTRSWLESLDYIAFQDGEHVLRSWMAHHLKKKNMNLNIRAQVMSVNGVMNFIKNGLGVGILPHHAFESTSLVSGQLQTLEGSGRPMTNTISMVWLKDRSPQVAVDAVKESLLESTKNF